MCISSDYLSFSRIKQEANSSSNIKDLETSVPSLSSSTIKIQYRDINSGDIRTWSTQTNRPPQTILHDYCTRIYKKQAVFEESTTTDEKNPWKISVKLPDDKIYGSGIGIKKRFAKEAAITQTLEMLIPEYKEKRTNPLNDQFFDHLDILNYQAAQYLQQAGHLTPLALLEKVLVKQNSLSSGKCAGKPNFTCWNPKKLDGQQNINSRKLIYEMTCGKHKVTGKAENQKQAKQLGAAQILKLLHRNSLRPVKSWGDLLRIYQDKPYADLVHESTDNERDILGMKGVQKNMQSRREPNWNLLTKLRSMMEDIHDKRDEANDFIRKNIDESDSINTQNCYARESTSDSYGGLRGGDDQIQLSSQTTKFYDHRPSPFPGQDVFSSLAILDL